MPGGAEGNPLRSHLRIRPLAVVGGDQLGDINQHCCGRRLTGKRIESRTQVVASAALLSLMRCMSSFHDLTNDAAPSTCNCAASASTSTPAFAKPPSTCSASAPSFAMTALTLPFSAKASKVFSGMVSMVSGAASASTYSAAGALGSLTPVLAH